jgi:hypothetical protein
MGHQMLLPPIRAVANEPWRAGLASRPYARGLTSGARARRARRPPSPPCAHRRARHVITV